MAADFTAIHGNSNSHVEFLKSELAKLVQDEEQGEKHQNKLRADLQDLWNKLVTIRRHIQRMQSDIDDIHVELAALEVEKGYWNDEIDGVDFSALSLSSIPRAVTAGVLREKLLLKDNIQANMSALDEELANARKKQILLSGSLKSSISSPGPPGTPGVIDSMEIRTELIAVSKHLEVLEDNLRSYTQQLLRVQGDLAAVLPQTKPVPMVETMPIASPVRVLDEDMLSLVSHGLPFTKELSSALLDGPVVPVGKALPLCICMCPCACAVLMCLLCSCLSLPQSKGVCVGRIYLFRRPVLSAGAPTRLTSSFSTSIIHADALLLLVIGAVHAA